MPIRVLHDVQRERAATLVEDQAQLLAALSRPAVFGPGCPRVERLETHMSWFFLTDANAWKLKKPARTRDLDISTEALRRADCDKSQSALRVERESDAAPGEPARWSAQAFAYFALAREHVERYS